jgi:hypothetical protein
MVVFSGCYQLITLCVTRLYHCGTQAACLLADNTLLSADTPMLSIDNIIVSL